MSLKNDIHRCWNYRPQPIRDRRDSNESGKLWVNSQSTTPRKKDHLVIKRLFIRGLSEIMSMQKEFIREVQILFACRHPAIVEFRGFSMCDDEMKFSPTIALDFKENGSLTDVLQKKLSILDNTAKMKILYGIAKGMEFLHSRNIIHRDLGTNNVLVDEHFNPFITDFGKSKIVDVGKNSTNNVGTPIFSPPEVFTENRSSPKSDVFAFAVIMVYVISGKLAYDIKGQVNIYNLPKYIVSGHRAKIDPEKIPEQFINLITKCWENDENDRPDFSTIVRLFDDSLVLPDVGEEYQRYKTIFADSGKEEYEKAEELVRVGKYEDAVQFFELSEREGYVEASIKLGKCYMKGQGVCRNQIEGFTHFMKAAQKNYVKGFVKVGKCYYFGLGTEQSFEKAAEYYQKAADCHNSSGFVGLGFCFLKNMKIQSANKAFEYFKCASDDDCTKGKYCLAHCYMNGIGCNNNKSECIRLLNETADKGYQRSIFTILQFIRLKKMDFGFDPIKKYQPLADGGDSMAQFCMGEILWHGIGCEPNHDLALKYYQSSAEQKNSYGQYGYGECFGSNSESKEPEKAFYYYKSSYDQGNEIAAYRLYNYYCYPSEHVGINNPRMGEKYYYYYNLSTVRLNR